MTSTTNNRCEDTLEGALREVMTYTLDGREVSEREYLAYVRAWRIDYLKRWYRLACSRIGQFPGQRERTKAIRESQERGDAEEAERLAQEKLEVARGQLGLFKEV